MVLAMTILQVLAILACSTGAVVWGSVIALRERRSWGFLMNTTGLLGFWAAGLLPFLPENNFQPARKYSTSVPFEVSEPNVTYTTITYNQVDPPAQKPQVDMTQFYESPFGYR